MKAILAIVAAVAFLAPQESKDFGKRPDWSVTLPDGKKASAADYDKKVMKEWGAYGEKMMYGKKTVGIIRSSVWIGPDGVVKKHWKKVADAAKHPEQVLETLRG